MMNNRNKPPVRFGKFSEDWKQRQLTELVEFYSGLTYSPNDIRRKGVLVLRSSNVSNGEIVDSDNVYVTPSAVNCEYVRKGDIVIVVRNGSRSLIGKHAEIKRNLNNTVVGAFMTGIRSEHHSYVNALLDTSNFDKQIKENIGATINQITGYMFSKMGFLVPQSDEEKHFIGMLFCNIDKAIILQRRKIEKLRNIRNSCLANMFPRNGEDVPKIRFHGFDGKWEKRKLGNIGKTYTGLSGKTKEDFGHGKARFITYMNVFSNPICDPGLTEPIEPDSKQNEVEIGDVFFTISSETPEEVGMSSVLLEKKGKTYLNSFCFGFRPSQKIDSLFLAYLLRCPSVRSNLIVLAQGISRYNISRNKVMEIEIDIPSLDEQYYLGRFFFTYDRTIALQCERLEKLKNIKKAFLEKMFL